MNESILCKYELLWHKRKLCKCYLASTCERGTFASERFRSTALLTKDSPNGCALSWLTSPPERYIVLNEMNRVLMATVSILVLVFCQSLLNFILTFYFVQFVCVISFHTLPELERTLVDMKLKTCPSIHVVQVVIIYILGKYKQT